MRKILGLLVFLLVLTPILGGVAAAADNTMGNIVRLNEDIVIPAGHTVNGNVVSISGNIEVMGTVKGNVVSVLGDVTVRNSGRVQGEAVAVLGGMIADGSIQGSRVGIIEGFPSIRLPNWIGRINHFNLRGFHYGTKAMGLLFQALITIVLVLLVPRAVSRVQVNIRKNPIAAGGIGLLTIFGGGALAFFFAITIIGIPVALLLGFLLGMLGLVAKYLGGAAIGLWVGQAIFKGEQTPLVSALVGSLLVGLLLILPFTGLIGAIVGLMTMGGVIATCFGLKGEEIYA